MEKLMNVNFNYNYWKTSGGQIIRIDKMTVDHLKNVILKVKNDWVPKLEQEFRDYKIRWNSTEWDCPCPFESVEDFRPEYNVLMNYKKVFELELQTRKPIQSRG